MLAHGRERKRGKKEKDDRTAFNSFLSNIINPLLHELSNHCFKKNGHKMDLITNNIKLNICMSPVTMTIK